MKKAGVFSVRIAFSSVNFELEVVSDGVCVKVFDWMGGADADGDVFPLVGVPNLVLVRKLPYAGFSVRRRSASVAASWGRLCLREGTIGDEFNTGGGAMGIFPHPVCIPVTPSSWERVGCRIALVSPPSEGGAPP